MITKSLLILFIFVLVIGLVSAAGLYRASRENASMIDRIVLPQGAAITIDLSPQVYAELPPPVRRYFDYAFNGQDSITLRGVEWDQSGGFVLPVIGQFRAQGHQINHPNQPIYAFMGWFWRYGLPLIESRDAYFGDRHDMRAKLLGWLTVMHTAYIEREQIASLHSYLVLRYYGQAPLMPWALLPNDHVAWEARDASSAYLVITQEGLAGRYLVTFSESGEITSMDGDRLLMEGNGTMQREVGIKSAYQEVNGFMVPTRMGYRWFDESGRLISHFTSEITNLRIIVQD